MNLIRHFEENPPYLYSFKCEKAPALLVLHADASVRMVLQMSVAGKVRLQLTEDLLEYLVLTHRRVVLVNAQVIVRIGVCSW